MSTAQNISTEFSADEQTRFRESGFLICRGLIADEDVAAIRTVAERDLVECRGDIEYECDVRYPGAPESPQAAGGRTVRRLRQAFSRDPVFARLLKQPVLVDRLKQLLGSPVVMPLAHHNCIMTKHPRYSSDTGWHQDTRYWSFPSGDLVNVWIALTEESEENGCLRLLPGTHRAEIRPQHLDERQFLRTDTPDGRAWLESAVTAELSPGDVLFFHARCFHSATRNFTDRTKFSAVFTFRRMDNPPIAGTRSASLPELLLQ